jgi:CheY-like chemotaxis protein/HPt (histidine-containing phosphotransfer) domain-containing protein
LELVSDVAPDVPDALVGDAGRLRQVLLNLIGNAIKFTDHGEVVVRVEIVSGELVSGEWSEVLSGTTHNSPVTAHQSSLTTLRFTVRDTGIGIPKEKQGRIFRAFEQEDTSTTRRYGGTGLGLTIASRLVSLMGGSIAVESEPGRGSVFAFTAQLGRQPHEREPAAAQPPVLVHGLPVLIVDDNAMNRQILDGWLRGWQMKPAAVGDGLSALDALWHCAACGRPYALVLLDARMPDVDGLALVAQIRQRSELSDTRIILLTSGDRPGDLARSRALRVDAYLLKPVQQDELLETIYRVMSRPVQDKETGRKGDKETGRQGDREPRSDGDGDRRAPVSLSRLRILVAEDNEFNAQLLEQLLGRRGHRVRVAHDGREALSLVEERSFDLLLLDVHMPELDGFQVVEAIRERERGTEAHLPVIALTARARPEDQERCLAAGMDDFLAKPIHAASLWEAIDRAVERNEGGRGKDGQQGSALAPSSSAHPSSIEDGLIDAGVLMAACGGDAGILEKICQAFRARLPDQLRAVRDALRQRQAPRLREAAHKLCGMLAAFSTAAGGAASELEDYAAQDQLEEAAPLLAQLETMTEKLMRAASGLSLEVLRESTAHASHRGVERTS